MRIAVLLTVSLYVSHTLFGYIDVLELKNTYSCVSSSSSAMLSPLVGALSWNSGWIESFCRFGDKESACVKLVQKIFYYEKDAGEFAIQKGERSVARLLAEYKLISEVIQWYINNRKNFEDKDLFEKGKVDLKNKLMEMPQLKNDERGKKLLGKDLNKIILNRIANAYSELNNADSLLPAFVLDQILATYWFMAQENSSGMRGYIDILSGGSQCVDEVPSKYLDEDLIAVKKDDNEEIKILVDKNPELLAVFLLESLTKGSNPPKVITGSRSYGVRSEVADCVESTIRNFFNFILFDGKSYNFNLLPEKISASVNSELSSFYEKFPIGKTVSDDAGQAWFELIASLHKDNPSITYKKDGCEVVSNEENAVKIINVLLGTDAKSFNDFENLFSTQLRSVEVGHMDSGEFIVDIGERRAVFDFAPGHAKAMFYLKSGVNSIFNVLVHGTAPINLAMLAMRPGPLFTGNYRADYYLYQGRNLANPDMLVDIFKGIVKVFSQFRIDDDNTKKYCEWLRVVLSQIREKDLNLLNQCYGFLMKFYNSIPPCVKDIIKEAEMALNEQLFIAAKYGGSKEFIDKLIKEGAEVDAKDVNEWTVLVTASFFGHKDIVEQLIENKATVDAVSVDGRTPLMSATGRGHLDVVKVLIDNNADVDARGHYGETALMHAASLGHVGVAEWLIENNALVDAEDADGETALMKAAKEGYSDMVALLIKKGATLNKLNKRKLTALMLAVDRDRVNVVREFAKAKDFNMKDEGVKALMRAVNGGYPNVVKVLIDQGVNVDTPLEGGWTPLMWAVGGDKGEIVSALLEGGADLQCKNDDGQMALDIAKDYGSEDMRKLMIKASS